MKRAIPVLVLGWLAACAALGADGRVRALILTLVFVRCRGMARRRRAAKGMGNHPVLRGVGPLVVRDEAYRGMWLSPKITVLMETDNPKNDRPVVYLGPHARARAIYIQLGHGPYTLEHPGYRRLVHNAILRAARKEP